MCSPPEWVFFVVIECLNVVSSSSHDHNNKPKIMGFDAYKKLVTPGFYGAKKQELQSPER